MASTDGPQGLAGTQRHLVTSTDVHHLVAATSPAGIDTRRARSFDGARPEGPGLSAAKRSRPAVGAILAALKLALDEFAAFVFPRTHKHTHANANTDANTPTRCGYRAATLPCAMDAPFGFSASYHHHHRFDDKSPSKRRRDSDSRATPSPRLKVKRKGLMTIACHVRLPPKKAFALD